MTPIGVACLKTPPELFEDRPLRLLEGRLPEGLSGRLLRIGPGRFEDARGPFPHWFDGEGLVLAITLADGRAHATARFVDAGPRGPGRAVLGRFGRAPQGAWRRLASLFRADMYVNAANTALMAWNGRLFALFEAAPPVELDPETLETIGAADLGVVRRAFSAHPKARPGGGALINQGFRLGRINHLDYVALEPGGAARRLGSARYAGAAFNHDFAVTERRIVSICCPVFPDLAAAVLRGRPLSEALVWRPERGVEILVAEGDAVETPARLSAPAFGFSHTAQAYDDGADVVVQGVVSPDASGLDWVASVRRGATRLAAARPGRLTEIRLSPGSGAVALRPLAEAAIDFPVVNEAAPSPRRHVYAAGYRQETAAYRDLFDAVLKIDATTGAVEKVEFGAGHFVSEAAFAPAPGGVDEDDGWLLTVNYDVAADDSYLAILSAAGRPRILARLSLGQALPMSFHGLWEPAP